MLRRFATTLMVLVLGAAVASSVGAISPLIWRIFFSRGSSTVSPDAEKTLVQVAAWFRNTGGAGRLFINAHADSDEAQLHADLSPVRAEAVENRLVSLGVPSARLVLAVYGDSQPLVRTAPGAAEPQNRNVEIVPQIER